MKDEQENQGELKVGDFVYVNWTNIDGMCGDGIYGTGTITDMDSYRKEISVEMNDIWGNWKIFTVPAYSVTKSDI